MITFHPAARKTASGYIPMVTLRAAQGRMVGSKLSQTGSFYATEAAAKSHALLAALRVAIAHPSIMTVAR